MINFDSNEKVKIHKLNGGKNLANFLFRVVKNHKNCTKYKKTLKWHFPQIGLDHFYFKEVVFKPLPIPPWAHVFLTAIPPT